MSILNPTLAEQLALQKAGVKQMAESLKTLRRLQKKAKARLAEIEKEIG